MLREDRPDTGLFLVAALIRASGTRRMSKIEQTVRSAPETGTAAPEPDVHNVISLGWTDRV